MKSCKHIKLSKEGAELFMRGFRVDHSSMTSRAWVEYDRDRSLWFSKMLWPFSDGLTVTEEFVRTHPRLKWFILNTPTLMLAWFKLRRK